MKKSGIFAILFLGALVLTWGCGDKETVVFNPCGDGELSGQETDVDCGGPSCDPCPIGKTCLLDSDCDSGLCLSGVCAVPQNCGNGDIDEGETCDGDCPTSCDDEDPCTDDLLTGSAANCTAECFFPPITACDSGDGCCPAGCDADNDTDCGGGGDFALRLNGGLESGTSTFDGKEFLPLRSYIVSGSANSSGNYGDGIPIAGTVFDELYQLEMYVPEEGSPLRLDFPVPNGDYVVHLHFVDWTDWTSGVGERVFDVDLQGERVLDDFDIVVEVGKNAALIKSFDVSVSGGSIELTITNNVFFAEIAAVEILGPGQPYLGQGTEEPPCGDGIIDAGETCDDGDMQDGDGCSSVCQVESGWTCDGEPSVCTENDPGASNSVNLIWEDSFGPNIGDPSSCNEGYGQFRAVTLTFPIDGSFPRLNAWNELISEGTGESCGESINTATNTLVQFGRFAYWVYYENGGWQEVTNTTLHGGLNGYGTRWPVDIDSPHRGCSEFISIRQAHTDYQIYRGARDNLGTYKPEYYWDYHGFDGAGGHHEIDYARQPKAVLATLWARLIVDEGPSDDRNDAKFLIHVASDAKALDGSSPKDIGMSRWKRVTTEWQPFNFLTGGWTKEQFIATNPPVLMTPQ